MKENLTEEELNERIAIVKRFRSLLEQQRAKFQEYLFVLEKQHDEIEADNTDSMYAHTDLENQIVSNIQSLQKVIVPMQELYKSTSNSKFDDASIKQIQSDLDSLQNKVSIQNKKNRELLQIRMNVVKTQMNSVVMNNPYRGRRSIYADRQSGSVISIES